MSDTPTPEPAPRCRNLCCKSMLVYGEDFESDPEYQPGLTDFWCLETAQATGPDGALASLEVCANRERPCYREF